MNDLAERRRSSPLVQARGIAFGILRKHPDCLQDDVVLDELLEDIAQAVLAGVNITSPLETKKARPR